MYLDYWGISEYPFENVSDARFFFESNSLKMIDEDLGDAIRRHKGAIVLAGEIGCGKSTITQHILLSLPEEQYDIALITYSRLTSSEMMLEIAEQLGLSPQGDDKNRVIHALQEHLVANAEQNRHTLICIDEAQSIPSLSTFEELRLLLNFQLGDRFLLTLLFVGQPELQRKIAKIPQLQQRIALNLNIGQLDLQDAARYILHRLHVAGSDRPILTRQAVAIIHRHTAGIPRRINHLMDRCLLVGMRENARLIDTKLVTTTMQRYPC
jgi:general secretion pathway protein A